jgi:hypothetical protein
MVDGKLPHELSGLRSFMEGKDRRESADIPASYVAYPPVSPVGRA